MDDEALYSCYRVAERGEWAMKEYFHKDEQNHLSGEFYIAKDSEIEFAWKIGRETALKEESKLNG